MPKNTVEDAEISNTHWSQQFILSWDGSVVVLSNNAAQRDSRITKIFFTFLLKLYLFVVVECKKKLVKIQQILHFINWNELENKFL